MGDLRFLGIHRRGTFSVLSGDGSVLREGGAEEAFLFFCLAIFNFIVEIYKPLIKEYHTSTLMALA